MGKPRVGVADRKALYDAMQGGLFVLREHGIEEIRTADADFLQFRFLTVVSPLESKTA